MSINAAHHCTLMRHITIKEKTTEVKGAHKYSTKSLSTHFLSRIFLPYWLKHRKWFGWRHTGMLLFHPVHFVGFPSTETIPFTTSSIRYNKELNCWFFASSSIRSHHPLLERRMAPWRQDGSKEDTDQSSSLHHYWRCAVQMRIFAPIFKKC